MIQQHAKFANFDDFVKGFGFILEKSIVVQRLQTDTYESCVISIDRERNVFICGDEEYDLSTFLRVVRNEKKELRLVFGDMTMMDGDKEIHVYSGMVPAPILSFGDAKTNDIFARGLPLIFA